MILAKRISNMNYHKMISVENALRMLK